MRHRARSGWGLAVVVGLIAVASGCNDDDPQNPTLACDNRSLNGTCVDLGTGFSESEATATCSGGVIEGACPTADTVGRCTTVAGGRTLVENYYSQFWDATAAEADCALGGGSFN